MDHEEGALVFNRFVSDLQLRCGLSRVDVRPLPLRGARVFRFRDRRSSAPSVIRALAFMIREQAKPPIRAAGFEYWTNALRAGDRIARHVDKDEALFRACGVIVSPVLTAVYYPPPCAVAGGVLSVAGRRIRPMADRLVLFPGHLTHGVTRVTAGLRKSIVLNFWSRMPLVGGAVVSDQEEEQT